jgi:transcriptional regulator with XRE-family HTH domain
VLAKKPKKSSLSFRIGMVIRQLRTAQGMTQAKLATLTGVRQNMLSMIERGERNSRINVEALERIAKALNHCSLSSFIQIAESTRSENQIFKDTRQGINILRMRAEQKQVSQN